MLQLLLHSAKLTAVSSVEDNALNFSSHIQSWQSTGSNDVHLTNWHLFVPHTRTSPVQKTTTHCHNALTRVHNPTVTKFQDFSQIPDLSFQDVFTTQKNKCHFWFHFCHYTECMRVVYCTNRVYESCVMCHQSSSRQHNIISVTVTVRRHHTTLTISNVFVADIWQISRQWWWRHWTQAG